MFFIQFPKTFGLSLNLNIFTKSGQTKKQGEKIDSIFSLNKAFIRLTLWTTEMSKIEFILITIKSFIWGNQGHWAHLCINPNNLWRVISLCLQALDNRNFRESGTNSNRRIFREIHPTLLKKIYSTSRKMFISWTSSWSPSGDLFNFYTIFIQFWEILFFKVFSWNQFFYKLIIRIQFSKFESFCYQILKIWENVW